MRILILSLFILGFASIVTGGNAWGFYDPYFAHTFKKIDTCYHWLDPHELDAKVAYAQKNNGDLFFYNKTPIYCWRSPLGAYSSWEDHGNVLMRIKFKPNTRIKHHTRVSTIDKFSRLRADVIYSNDNSWHEYTIAPSAVESWSVNQPKTVEEMKAEFNYYDSDRQTDDDVFYPYSQFNLSWLKANLLPVIETHEEFASKKPMLFGSNPDDHFKTKFPLPWQTFLDKEKYRALPVIKPAVMTMQTAKFGATDVMKLFVARCNNRTSCQFKLSTQYLSVTKLPVDEDFEVTWKCTGKVKIFKKNVAAPIEDKILDLDCPLAKPYF